MLFPRRTWAVRVVERMGIPIKSAAATCLIEILVWASKQDEQMMKEVAGFALPIRDIVIGLATSMVHNQSAVKRLSDNLGVPPQAARMLLTDLRTAGRALAVDNGLTKVVELADRRPVPTSPSTTIPEPQPTQHELSSGLSGVEFKRAFNTGQLLAALSLAQKASANESVTRTPFTPSAADPHQAKSLLYSKTEMASDDPLIAQANGLVGFAKMNSTSSFLPTLENFPVLRDTRSDQWDFVMVIAGAFIAVTRLNKLNLGDAKKDELLGIVGAQMKQWNPLATDGFADCRAFFDRTFDKLTRAGQEPRFVSADALGLWIVWNILQHQPRSDDELKLARTIGEMVIHTFFDWWNV